MKKIVLTLFLIFALSLSLSAYEKEPGKGITVRPARATWDTGYFQEALVRRALKTLGYNVQKPKELQNPLFYKSVVLGDVDYWVNGWFPMHWAQTPKNFKEKAGIYGTVVKAGGLGGYLASKEAVEKYNIVSLDDFKREEVKKAFDSNGDGKANLVACPPGWGCAKVIEHHLDVYDLKPHINPITASYSASMAEAIAKHRKGKPVLFYTWAPNWTVYKLKPGEDVMWINVPEIKPTPAQEPSVDRMVVSGVKGAVTDPLKAGFVVSDINIVANHKFMEKNPPIKAFFEVFSLPLEDINEQNAKMYEGEKSEEDIERHVDEWIAKNLDKWNSWLETARKAAK